ncbi:MAG: hypothetical protein MZU97_24650 [Bacillus subtilis]|nr:hypothetical protein [Bacillus subtilis]
MLDLHTAPGSQNGFDNGGIDGVLSWHLDPKNIDVTVDVLDEIAKRYKDHPALHSIQALNEPHWTIDLAILQAFYCRACTIACGRFLKPETAIVFHDGFRMKPWQAFFANAQDGTTSSSTSISTNASTTNSTRWTRRPSLTIPGRLLPDAQATWRQSFRVDRRRMEPRRPGKSTIAGTPRRVRSTRMRSANSTRTGQVTGWVFWSYKITDPELAAGTSASLVESGII